MLVRRLVLPWLVLLVLVPGAVAEEPLPDDVATKVLDALDANDRAALAQLARGTAPDPWLVVESLLDVDESEAAGAFARAVPRGPATKQLVAYVRSQAGAGRKRRDRELYERVEDALDAGNDKRVRTLTANLRGVAPGVRRVELHAMRAEALVNLEQPGKAAAAAQRGAEDAAALGWLDQAARLHDRAGHASRDAGDGEAALAAYARAIETWGTLDHVTAVVRSMTARAVVHEDRGEYAASVRAFEAAQAELGDHKSPTDEATILGGLGRVHEAIGNLSRARGYLERCLALRQKVGDKSLLADAYVDLASLHSHMGDERTCLAMNQKALALFEEAGVDDGAATALGNIGAAYEDLGEIDKALVHYERALDVQGRLADRGSEAKTRENIGLLLSEHDEHAKARPYLEAAVRMAREIGERPQLASALESLARGHYAARRLGPALDVVEEARSVLRGMLADLGEEETTATRGEYSGMFVIGAAAATQRKDYTRAISFLEEGRAMTLASVLARPERGRVPAALRTEERSALAAVDAARRAQQGAADAAAAKRALDEALDALRQVRDRIRKATGVEHVDAPPAADLAAVQAALRPGQVFVFYLVAGDDVLAVCVRAGATCSHVLPGADGVRAAVRALHDGGGVRSRGLLRREPTRTQKQATDPLVPLRTQLVEPLQLGPTDTHVIVSPAGILGYVPFGAITGRPTVVVPSATTWLLLRSRATERGSDVLALGNPDYAGKTRGTLPVRLKDEVPTPLPATKPEVEAVGDVKLLGADANELRFREAAGRAERWRALHFACHGLLDAHTPRLSALALSRTRPEDDGLLSALEILGMRLRADMAVLSACETGRGKVVDGEGIQGLTRAFMYAGVPRVLCSLWKVDDRATRVLMERFYALWNPDEGTSLPASEALAKAQAHVRAQPGWEHPYYWAAWVLWGLPD